MPPSTCKSCLLPDVAFPGDAGARAACLCWWNRPCRADGAGSTRAVGAGRGCRGGGAGGPAVPPLTLLCCAQRGPAGRGQRPLRLQHGAEGRGEGQLHPHPRGDQRHRGADGGRLGTVCGRCWTPPGARGAGGGRRDACVVPVPGDVSVLVKSNEPGGVTLSRLLLQRSLLMRGSVTPKCLWSVFKGFCRDHLPHFCLQSQRKAL